MGDVAVEVGVQEDRLALEVLAFVAQVVVPSLDEAFFLEVPYLEEGPSSCYHVWGVDPSAAGSAEVWGVSLTELQTENMTQYTSYFPKY